MLRVIVLDPGKTCGLGVYVAPQAPGAGQLATAKVALDALPARLYAALESTARSALAGDITVLVCESFALRGGKLAQQQAGSSMPASEGVGVLRGVAHSLGFAPPVMVAPSCKGAGHAYAAKHLPGVAAAYADATNDHERDVCDLAGFYLRQRILGKA